MKALQAALDAENGWRMGRTVQIVALIGASPGLISSLHYWFHLGFPSTRLANPGRVRPAACCSEYSQQRSASARHYGGSLAESHYVRETRCRQQWSLQTGKLRQTKEKLISAVQVGLIFLKPLLGFTKILRKCTRNLVRHITDGFLLALWSHQINDSIHE